MRNLFIPTPPQKKKKKKLLPLDLKCLRTDHRTFTKNLGTPVLKIMGLIYLLRFCSPLAASVELRVRMVRAGEGRERVTVTINKVLLGFYNKINLSGPFVSNDEINQLKLEINVGP